MIMIAAVTVDTVKLTSSRNSWYSKAAEAVTSHDLQYGTKRADVARLCAQYARWFPVSQHSDSERVLTSSEWLIR